jgi:PrcB C-terminal
MRAALLFAVATLLGCASDAPVPAAGAVSTGPEGTVEMRVVTSGGYAAAQPESPKAVLVQSAEEYRQLTGAELQGADLGSESVIVLLAGSKRTGGYSVEPNGVTVEGNVLVVDATITSPPPGSMVTQAFTSPFAAIAVSTKRIDTVRWTP